MPWRLIQFIAICAVFILFIMFNLDNRSDVSLGFVEFGEVPVFLTVFFSFTAGMALTLPFIVGLWLKSRKGGSRAKKPKKKAEKKAGEKAAPNKKEGKPDPDSTPEPIPAELKDYGID